MHLATRRAARPVRPGRRPRVAYWTSALFPEMEAVASEVATLRRHFPGSAAWGVSPNCWLRPSWRRGLGIHPRFHLAFRAVSAICQHAFDVNHLFGGLGDWFHLRAVRRRPVVLTVAVQGEPGDRGLLEKVDRFAVEWPGAWSRLVELGVDEERIRLIYPPVDLDRFRPSGSPTGPFTVLFASSPDRSEVLRHRGVDLLLDAARLRPDVRFRLLWRPWGDALPTLQGWIRERGLGNVEVVAGRIGSMEAQYRQAHATVAPFRDLTHCKPTPNSILESLASGRPVLVTDRIGIADMVRSSAAGAVFRPAAEDLALAVDQLQDNWADWAGNARLAAERAFDEREFIRQYVALYEELL